MGETGTEQAIPDGSHPGGVPTFVDRARSDPDDVALVDPVRHLSWAELADEVLRVARTLRDLPGVGGNRGLAVVSENSAAVLIAYAAAVLAGLRVIPVNHQLALGELAYVVRDSGARAIWSDEVNGDLAAGAARSCGVALIGECEPAWTRRVATAEPASIDWDRTAATNLVYTSGTTGFPKGVEVPRAPSTLAERFEEYGRHHLAGLGSHMVAGPMYHAGPHGAVGLSLIGTSVVVAGRFDAARTLDLIERHRVATSVMVPTHFSRILALPPEVLDPPDVSSLKLISQTGSHCPVPLKLAMIERFGPVFREAYGGSEAGIITAITSKEWMEHPGSVGRAIAPFEIVVVDDSGTPRSPGEEGRLYFRDTTGRGIRYHGDPEKTAAAHIEPGVFTLGDLGHVDADGYLFVTGRVAELVVSGGVNIYPAECERVLITHPAVVDVAVFGVPDAEMTEKLVGVVTVSDAEISADDLVAYARARIAHYKVPRELALVDEVPRNAMGKIDRRDLAARFGTRFEGPSGADASA